jgi:hypothetical protein
LSLLAVLAGLAAAGCGPADDPVGGAAPPGAKPATVMDLNYLRREDVGAPVTDHPWVCNVTAVDLDHDGLMDIIACEGMANKVLWERQVSRGKFQEIVLSDDIAAPVHATPVDMRGTGHYDLLIASMGQVPRTTTRSGRLSSSRTTATSISPRGCSSSTLRG